jgi:hypothetical protein
MARKAKLAPSGETKKKREARTRKLRQSPHTKAIRLERLALCRGQCEFLARVWSYRDEVWWNQRCVVVHDEPDPLHMHHLTYARLGHELIDDVVMYCKAHHELIEARDFPHRKRA